MFTQPNLGGQMIGTILPIHHHHHHHSYNFLTREIYKVKLMDTYMTRTSHTHTHIHIFSLRCTLFGRLRLFGEIERKNLGWNVLVAAATYVHSVVVVV